MKRLSVYQAAAVLLTGMVGCSQIAPLPEYEGLVRDMNGAGGVSPRQAPVASPLAAAPGPPPTPPGLSGPQPVDAYIRHALAENRLVQAARYNVLALRYRIPQVTALDDPVVSNTYYPSPTNGFQTPDGFMPWNLLIAQQFPWFGTLALRGLAAEQDVQVAVAELCAAQLDVVEAVKRAYFDLHFAEQAARIIQDNRALVEDFIEIARVRYETGDASQQDLLSAEVVLTDLDRELVTIEQAIATARADLAEQLHVDPESDLRTLPAAPVGPVPAQIDRLYQLAVAARPELKGRLAAVARDATAVELARKRYRPNVTLGFNYGLTTTSGSMVPNPEGNDMLGMFLGFNVPLYRAKIDGAVREAQARALADARLYEAERDGAFRTIKDQFTQARAQQRTLELLTVGILPRARQALELAAADYEVGTVDFLTLITAWREVLQIELQVAQIEAELGKSLASLERAVGLEISRHPPAPATAPADAAAPAPPPPPVAEDAPAPFQDRQPAPGPADPGADTPGEDRVGTIPEVEALPIPPRDGPITSTPSPPLHRPR